MQTRGRLAAVAWLVVLAVAGGGCGGDDDDKSSATTANTRFPPPVEVENKQIREGEDACGLLTRSEIESAAGVSVNPGDGVTTKAGTSSCAYRVRSNTAQFVGVLVQTPGPPNFESAQRQLGSSVENLPGVGERAFVATDIVYALKGDKLLIVTVSTSQPPATRKQAAIALSRSAIGKV